MAHKRTRAPKEDGAGEEGLPAAVAAAPGGERVPGRISRTFHLAKVSMLMGPGAARRTKGRAHTTSQSVVNFFRGNNTYSVLYTYQKYLKFVLVSPQNACCKQETTRFLQCVHSNARLNSPKCSVLVTLNIIVIVYIYKGKVIDREQHYP